MKNKILILILTIIILTFVIILIPLKGSYAFYSDSKDLEIINTRVGNWKSTIDYLRMNDKNNNLSQDTPGDMHRYQGTDDVANWICFGTTENCGINDELIDNYMYRIIGITKAGELKLLKETFIKEGDRHNFAWNDTYSNELGHDYSCPDGVCPMWGSNTLYKRLNGLSNGENLGLGSYEDKADTNIFIDSKDYAYLKSTNGGSPWYNLIDSNHAWLYGDTFRFFYNGDQMYEIESGNVSTLRLEGIYGNVTEKPYTWTKSVEAPVGLLNISDYMYAYPGGNPENSDNVKKAWIHFFKDGYNGNAYAEWLMTRFGVFSTTTIHVNAFSVLYTGLITSGGLQASDAWVRPVFYLSSKAKIYFGKGTKENPFILT